MCILDLHLLDTSDRTRSGPWQERGLLNLRDEGQSKLDGDTVIDPVEATAFAAHADPVDNADHLSLLNKDGTPTAPRVHGRVELDPLVEADLADHTRGEGGDGPPVFGGMAALLIFLAT